MLIMSVIMVASKSVTAQTIETMKGPNTSDQLAVGGGPEDISVNEATNKVYILGLDSGNVIVTVLDSKSGTVKNIPIGVGESFFPTWEYLSDRCDIQY
jgi:DNA-binding beta-propeller fold protein YncE